MFPVPKSSLWMFWRNGRCGGRARRSELQIVNSTQGIVRIAEVALQALTTFNRPDACETPIIAPRENDFQPLFFLTSRIARGLSWCVERFSTGTPALFGPGPDLQLHAVRAGENEPICRAGSLGVSSIWVGIVPPRGSQPLRRRIEVGRPDKSIDRSASRGCRGMFKGFHQYPHVPIADARQHTGVTRHPVAEDLGVPLQGALGVGRGEVDMMEAVNLTVLHQLDQRPPSGP